MRGYSCEIYCPWERWEWDLDGLEEHDSVAAGGIPAVALLGVVGMSGVRLRIVGRGGGGNLLDQFGFVCLACVFQTFPVTCVMQPD